VVPDGDLDTATVKAHCRETLPGFKRPKVVSLGRAVPRTASGTVDREAVRERLRESGS
jgi:Acyl-CoA synthetases (AMP-forming)/AMP-acid ligases II